ncbi:MAG: signal peptidase I [Chloroflexi bacterium]|nr:signal peptidase I [Chloroflexota bacterium]
MLSQVISDAAGQSPADRFLSYKMLGVSMQPTIHDGQVVRVDTDAYRRHGPHRGDIILLWMPVRPPGWRPLRTVKRVIGLPGEVVSVREGEVYLDDRRLGEPYVRQPANYTLPPRRVPRGKYFVLGDNRSNSADSHVWGWLPRKDIIGKVELGS